jgi:hypothetical protein
MTASVSAATNRLLPGVAFKDLRGAMRFRALMMAPYDKGVNLVSILDGVYG